MQNCHQSTSWMSWVKPKPALHVDLNTLPMADENVPSMMDTWKPVPRAVYMIESLWTMLFASIMMNLHPSQSPKWGWIKPFPWWTPWWSTQSHWIFNRIYGCQLSLITTFALKLLPKTSYFLGNSNMINLLVYNGTGELLPATEVKLNLGNRIIKMIAIDTNLSCGSAYSFPTPLKWRKHTKCDVTSHSGNFSILLGDNK